MHFTVKTAGITILYPLTGCVVLASGLSFLALGIKSSLKSRAVTKTEVLNTNIEGQRSVSALKVNKVVFVTLMCVFLFLYVGAEIALGAYLTIFCVRSGFS